MSKKKKEEEENNEYWVHLHGFNEGYMKAIEDLSWTCIDCGNTYEPSVEECPNTILDQASASLRYAKYHKDSNV